MIIRLSVVLRRTVCGDFDWRFDNLGGSHLQSQVNCGNLNVRLTEHKQATRNGDINNHIAEHHLQTNHRIDWDSGKCITYCSNYYQRLTLESWFTNLEQTSLNRCLQLPAPYKRLIDNNNETDKQ